MKIQDKLILAAVITFILFIGLSAIASGDSKDVVFKDIQRYELEMEGLNAENNKYRSELSVLKERIEQLENNIKANSAKFQKLEGKKEAATEYLQMLTEGLDQEKQ